MPRNSLAFYPYVVVRVACRFCPRRGIYRLVRLGAKYDPEMRLDDLLMQLAGDCPHWHHRARWPEGCGAYFPDLEPSGRPPDLPRAVFRVIPGGKVSAGKW